MSIPNPTKTRTYDLTTPANGTYFDDEFNQIYENTNYLEQSRASLSDAPSGFLNLAGSRPSVTTVTYTADALIMPNGVKLASYNETADITVSGAGGLDTPSEAISTWYYIFAICDDDGATVSILLSTSATAPTLPGSYTQFKMIGWVFNDGAGDFANFNQKGSNMLKDVVQLFVNSAATTLTAVSLGFFIPNYKYVKSIGGDAQQSVAGITLELMSDSQGLGKKEVFNQTGGTIKVPYNLLVLENNVYHRNNAGGGAGSMWASSLEMRI